MPDHPSDQPPRMSLVPAVAFEGAIAIFAVVSGWIVGRNPLDELHYNHYHLLVGLAAGLVPLLLLLPCILFPIGPLRELLRVVDELLVPLFKDCSLVDFAIIAVLAGLGEEMLFRTIVQEGLADLSHGPAAAWIGLGLAAILFGLAHWVTPAYGVIAAMIGAYLGWIWLLSGNLLVPIAAHASYDFLALVYLVKIRRPTPPVP